MFLNLVLKEFRNGALVTKLKKKNFLSVILNVLVSIAFVILEVYLFKMLNAKLSAFEGASIAFLNIFLFAISVIIILYQTTIVRKTLYSKEDNDILINKPVSPVMNMLAKIVFVYFRNILMNFVIAFPVLIIYGYDNHVISRVMFLMFMYPFIISIFETGMSYLLSIPYQMIYRFLQKHFIVQVITSIVIVIALCFAYSVVLNAFLTLVRDNNIYAIFSQSTIDKLDNIANYLVPTKFYIQLLDFNFIGLFFILLISLVIFILGTSISSKIYLVSMAKEKENKQITKEKEIKIYSQTKALIRKELALYFEDSNSIFSFSSLLVIEPFLTVLVIQAMNTIFKTGMLSYVTSYFDYLSPLIQMLFISLFSTFINTSASFVISREKYRGIRICKTIPVSYNRHLIIKMIVPFVLSSISLFVTIIILMITKQVNVGIALLSFVFSLFLTVLLELLSISSDLKDPQVNGEESNRGAIISLLAIVVPLLSVSVIFLLTYAGVPLVGSFFIVLALLGVFVALYAFFFYKKASKRFVALEMRN